MMSRMETFLVRLWAPEDLELTDGGGWPLTLRGVVNGGPRHSPRPFNGPDQLVLQLTEALVERLGEREQLSRRGRDQREGT